MAFVFNGLKYWEDIDDWMEKVKEGFKQILKFLARNRAPKDALVHEFCSSTLITSLHVLTAAECVLKDEASVMTPNPIYNTPENVYVQLGQSWISGPKFRSISKITTHPLAFAANVFKDPANARILKGNLYNFGD